MNKIKRKTFTCKCGCGESREMQGNELTAKFIDRSHYGKWLKTNHNLWGSKDKETDKEWTEPKKETANSTSANTGNFPMFI